MTISLTHAFVSAIADGADTSVVRPTNWNAEHTITMATAKVLGRASAGTGVVEEIAVTGSGSVVLATSPTFAASAQLGTVSSATGLLKLANSGSANLTTIQAGAAANARTYTWPTDFGAAGTVLTDAAGNGTLSWAAGGSGSPGGSDTQVQFNDSSAFGGDSGLVFNKTTNVLTITGTGNSGSTAPLTVLPSSGTSFTKIFDNGTVIIDADSGTGSHPLILKYNGTTIFDMNFGGGLTIGQNSGNGSITIGGGNITLSGSGNIDMFEMTAPAGTANTARLFAVDSGGGKTVLKVIFGSGAAQTIATEP